MPPFGPPIPWDAVEDAVHDLWFVPATGLATDHVVWYGQNAGRPTTPFVMLKWGFVGKVGIDGVSNQPNPLTVGPLALTGAAGQPLSVPAHGLSVGDGPVQITGSGLPPPLAAATDYWAAPVDADHLNLATSFLNAKNGASLAVTGAGTGTLASTPDTVRAGQEVLRTASGVRRAFLDATCFGTSGIGSQGADQYLDAAVGYQPLVFSALNAAGVGVLKLGRVQAADGVIDTSVFEPRAILEVVLVLSSRVQVPATIIAQARGVGNGVPFDSGRAD